MNFIRILGFLTFNVPVENTFLYKKLSKMGFFKDSFHVTRDKLGFLLNFQGITSYIVQKIATLSILESSV